MKLSHVAAAALLSAASANVTNVRQDTLVVQGLFKLGQHIGAKGYPEPKTCTIEKARVRREWSNLSRSEKLNYIDALKCLARKPARTPSAIEAGAKSRYDDFVITHIQQTMSIHGTANFLSWHRYYLLAFEDALRNECGYKGYQPYNNWSLWADDPRKNPLIDGSDTSLSGDGSFVPNRTANCFPNEIRCTGRLPPANGGGCVTDGPLKDWAVNLGPVGSNSKEPAPNPQADGLGYNPRCMSRDINPYASAQTTEFHVTDLITNYHDIFSFQTRMQSAGPFMGVHTGGHFTIGGDAGSDFFNSPADPTFWFHHAMIDRVWWVWQNLDVESRKSVEGPRTFLDKPPMGNGTLGDVLHMGYAGVEKITVADAQSTFGGVSGTWKMYGDCTNRR